MQATIRDRLRDALVEPGRPGSFCTSGGAPAVPPGLEVEGMGPISVPLTARKARELKTLCEQAPYGKGEETLVDTRVRRVWRMRPGRFALTNPGWDRFVGETIARVQEALGLGAQKLDGHLYELLLYEPGSFFLPHRDGEKLDRMVATLVIVLPSSYEGGELVVRHEGRERTIDFAAEGAAPSRVNFAAFYADCEHEVRPLRKGYRLCLVYNLTLAGTGSRAKPKQAASAPARAGHVEAIASLLREWSEGRSPLKLAVVLGHRYTKGGTAWDALKGVDRARADVVAEAARRAGCVACLASLTLWESGYAEDPDESYGYGYRSRQRRRRDEEAQDDEAGRKAGRYTMEEVYESSLTAEPWADPEGRPLPVGQLNVEPDEILDPEALRDVRPEEQYEGYTGNEGMTLERWYRRVAILLWPERRQLEVLCDRDGRNAVPLLDELVGRLQEARPGEAAPLRAQCLGLAGAILATWGRVPPDRPWLLREEKRPDPLPAFAALGDPALIARLLGDVVARDASVDPGEALVPLCRQHGWPTFREALLALLRGTRADTLERNVRLFEHIAAARPRTKKEEWAELCRTLAPELASAFEAADRHRPADEWGAWKVDRVAVLAGLVRALIASGQGDLIARVAEHAQRAPKTYPLTSAQVPALEGLRPWLGKNLKSPCPALSRWVASCREQLEALTARAPEEPADYRREADIPCKCDDCAELKRFLAAPGEPSHRFSVAEKRRRHLEGSIDSAGCDLDVVTERRGSPHSLVCTKNKASYQARVKTYQENLEHLAALRAIEARLPR